MKNTGKTTNKGFNDVFLRFLVYDWIIAASTGELENLTLFSIRKPDRYISRYWLLEIEPQTEVKTLIHLLLVIW